MYDCFPVSDYLICPVCGADLSSAEQGVRCINGHFFDRSAEGYIHLLPANQMRTKQPGDNAQMISARHRFLSKGFYHSLADALTKSILDLNSLQKLSILDIGCGEGYYTQNITEAFLRVEMEPTVVGIDISKYALKYAGKRFRKIPCPSFFGVSSAYHLPIQNATMNIAINVFSPLAIDEIFRVLKPGGFFFYVIPAKRHLWHLKKVLYSNPYENKEEDILYPGFQFHKRIPCRDRILLPSREDIESLFSMTPYYWRCPHEGVIKLRSLTTLQTELEFDICIFQRKDTL